jgi:hypothetical protein
MTKDPGDRTPRWPGALLLLAALWIVLIRAPLILNAPSHVDSDLAVDGLTLREAVQGRWRWHYPGTPHIGTASVMLSWPQAMVLGATPEILVSGGTVAALGLLLGCFLLSWHAFGPTAAAWSLVPLTFGSTGAVWLSGRITGGHLLAAAWQAVAFAILASALRRGAWGFPRALALGLWCGFGLFVDSMFAVALVGISPVFLWNAGRARAAVPALAGLALGLLIGVVPREVGKRLEPHNAYGPQFEAVASAELLAGHAAILVRDCLPRLIAGHRLPGLESDPDPSGLTAPSAYRSPTPIGPTAIAATGMSLLLWLAATASLARRAVQGPEPAGRFVAIGLILSALATLSGFVVNRNIFNSDNYRYLVTLLVPWSVGFGLLMSRLVRGGPARVGLGALLGMVFAGLMTADLGDWYARFGWVDDRRLPVRAKTVDPLLEWLGATSRATWIEGGYWDVYRLIFLTGGRVPVQVQGRPFPIYPDRFPEWAPPPDADRLLIGRTTPESRPFLDQALREGGKVVFSARGATVVRRPNPSPAP